MPETPRIPLDVHACRDCRFSVPGTNEVGDEEEDFARCTHPSAAMAGKPLYHLALAEAPLCSTMRDNPVCGSDAKLFKPVPDDGPPSTA